MNLVEMINAVAERAIWAGIVNGIYGIDHWRRTFKLAEAIMKKTGGNKHIVSFAALCHDIGRVNHNRDRNHGYRGASVAIRVAGNIFAANPMSMALPKDFNGTMVVMGKIADIVSRHCLDHRPDYLEMQIVNDANILDRVRFDGKRSIDVSKFAMPEVSKKLIKTALKMLKDDPVPERKAEIIQVRKKLILPKGGRH